MSLLQQARAHRVESLEKGRENTEKETSAVTTEGDATSVYEDGCVNLTSQESDWLIDSNASFHVTPHGDIFSTYSASDFGDVRMGNCSASMIVVLEIFAWRFWKQVDTEGCEAYSRYSPQLNFYRQT